MADALDRIVERVQKLLALGRRGGTEAEAAAAMAKAQELLTTHNLDMATVEQTQLGSAYREKAFQGGGGYVYQRELWSEVARLNFCLHFRRYVQESFKGKVMWRNKHMIVGRTVNVRATIAMGEYLEQTIDRLCRDRLATWSGAGRTDGSVGPQFSSGWAVAFREGVADRVIAKIWDRRRDFVRAEAKRRRAAERAAAEGGSPTSVSLSHFVDGETDANIDFLHGAGTAAKWATDRAENAAVAAAEEKAHAAWAAAHPMEAAAQEEKRARAARRAGAGPSRRVNGSGYSAGYEAGARVGIDPQAGQRATGGRIL